MPAESKIERDVCKFADGRGLTVIKLAAPHDNGWPDREFLYKGIAMFIEFKRTGRTQLDPLQIVRRDTLIAQGFMVRVCNDIEEGKLMITQFKEGVDNARPL